MTVLPLAVRVPATVTALLAVIEALKLAAAFAAKTPFVVTVAAGAKVVGELTVTVLLVSVPSVTLPRALKLFPAVTVRAAVVVRGAAKVLAALTVSVSAAVVPSTVLPAAVRVLLKSVRLTEPVKLAVPLLCRVKRSVSCPAVLPLLVLTVVVLRIRLPPHLPVASCMPTGKQYFRTVSG